MAAIVKQLGKYRVSASVDGDVTHVVCGASKRTMSVLRGIARGLWILDASWLYESLENGSWLPEEPFEVFLFCPGAKVSDAPRPIRTRESHSVF